MFIRHGTGVGASLHFRDDSKDISNNNSNESSASKYKSAIIVAAIVGAFCVIGFAYLVFRRWQQSRTAKYSRSGRDDNDHSDSGGPATTETPSGNASLRHQGSVSTVDRNTSVRSVMTLPPYRPKPLENESVLGREGERDGIDVVVEMPTIEDEEAMREEEMDALYQIRLARRRQITAREERREARRVARAQNDQAALQAIRAQARTASSNNTQEIESLREEHNRAKESRQRAVSSVSYADLGVARHDGTRIRANSTESERVGLLSDAASIEASVRSPPATSQNFPRPSLHQRGRSASSVLSINTIHSDDPQQQQLQQQRSSMSSTGQHTRAGSSPELIDAADADLGDADLPAHSPPGYDEVSLNDLTPAHSRTESPYPEPPPDYSPGPGPTETRNRRVPAHVADLAAEASAADASVATPPPVAESGASSARSSSNDSQDSRRRSRLSGIPQLPSLHLRQLPQIVIEPSSAVPSDREQ